MLFLIILVIFILIWISPYMMNGFANDISTVGSGFDMVQASWAVIWVGGSLVAITIIAVIIAAIRESRSRH